MPKNLEVVINVVMHTDKALEEIMGKGDGILDQASTLVKEEAAKAVSPGVGPGPHPHNWPHVDTGDLAASLTKYGPYSEDKRRVMEVGGDGSVDYGKFLEVGFHGPSGAFYRYPWLLPALERLKGVIGRVVRRF